MQTITITVFSRLLKRHDLSLHFETIIKEHGGLLSRVASTYEANLSVRQELYQEICIAVWQSLKSFKHQSSIKTYILRVAHNRCITHVNKEANSFKSHTENDALEQADKTLINHNGDIKSLETDLMQSQQLEQMLSFIRELKLPARQVITLSLEGLAYDEIADITGLSKTNIGVMITRIRQQIKEQLADA